MNIDTNSSEMLSKDGGTLAFRAQWAARALAFLMLTVETDQTGRMPSLICLPWTQSQNHLIFHTAAEIISCSSFEHIYLLAL